MAINKLTVNGVEIPSVKSVTYKETVNSGVDLRPGCVSSAYIEAEVYGTQADAVAPGAEVSYYLVDADSNETLIGVFSAEPSIKTKNSYKFVAYDNANKLNVDFSAWLRDHQADFPMTRAALVAAACTLAGVTNATPNWTGSTQQVQAFYADGLTCRDILSYAAELSGFYVHCHENGQLYFHWYTSTPNTRIYPSSGVDGSETRYAYKQDGLNYANYTVPAIDGVAVHPSGEDDVAYIYPASPAGDNLLHIRDNILLTGADASVYNAAAQRIYTQMTAVGAYVPATASMFANECPYESGETVLVTDIQGVSFKTIVMSKTITASGVVLESTGNETQESGYENPQKALAQLASDVVQINKLKVGWAEIDQAIIHYLTANDVTAQNLTIVDANDNVIATFNSGGITFYSGGEAVSSYNASTVVLGKADDTHAEIDFNSFELYDKDGALYTSIGDMRDASGYMTVREEHTMELAITAVVVAFDINEVLFCSVNGTQRADFTVVQNAIVFSSALSVGDDVVIRYNTTAKAYKYDLGTRASGTTVGAYSSIIGDNQEASGTFSTVSGGQNNKATWPYATVGGGYFNTASSSYTFVGGGNSNNADARYAVVCGGDDNTATGMCSSVVGGDTNTASNTGAFVGGGYTNTASGSDSAVLCGRNNEAAYGTSAVIGGHGVKTNWVDEVAWGRYNASTTSSALETVGNGTSDSARSNARTLDTNGNEWLAGQINANTGNFRNGATSSGDIDITGGYLLRRLPAVPSAGTGYWLARVTESNGTTGRGGVQFLPGAASGDGIRLIVSDTVNGSTVSNILALYLDSNGNRTVAVSDKAAWQAGLGLVYVAGDTVTMGSYDRFAGDWRDTTNLWFSIPLTKPVASGVSAALSGSVIVISNGTRATVNLSNVTQTCRVTPNGIVVNLTWSSAPSYAVASGLANVQAYGATITFS